MNTKLITRQYRLQKWATIIAERNASSLTIHAGATAFFGGIVRGEAFCSMG